MFTAAPENTSQRNTSDQPESTLLENKTSKRGVLQFFFFTFLRPHRTALNTTICWCKEYFKHIKITLSHYKVPFVPWKKFYGC